MNKGAKEVYAVVTHGLFNGTAAERILNSDITKIVCTDSIQLADETRQKLGNKLEYVSLDLLLAELIRRIHQRESTEDLTETPKYKN